MAGKRIGVEKSKIVGEILKLNTTLTSLDLSGEEERKGKEKEEKKRRMNDRE